MIEKLEQIDRDIFLSINGSHNEFWDGVMKVMSAKVPWIPLYAVLLVMVYLAYRKRWWLVLVSVALLVVLSDQLSVLVKNSVERYRPCHNLELKELVHLVDGCGGMFGFVSSHAANTFGLAMLLSLLLRKRWKYFPLLIFAWALLVSYSRIYNGVHYPADIIGGALLGCLLAVIVYWVWMSVNVALDRRVSPYK